MMTDGDLDRLLDNWLGTEPIRADAHLIDEVAYRIRNLPQRSAWRSGLSQGRADAFMGMLPVTAAAIVLAVVVGVTLVPSSGGPWFGEGHTPSPTPIATSSPSARPTDRVSPVCGNGVPTCGGWLAAGPHHSIAFSPAFTFEVPAGWVNPQDIRRFFDIFPPPSLGTDEIHVEMWSNPSLAEQTGCETRPQPVIPEDVDGLLRDIMANPFLDVSNPRPAEVGGAQGQMLDIRVSADWNLDCSVALMSSRYRDGIWFPSVTDRQPMRLTILEVHGDIVLIGIYSTQGAAEAGDLAAAITATQPFLSSLEWEVGG